MNKLALRPSYWASVSGGKDSLYMLYFILQHMDEYPLDGVVHFELEIDYPFIKNVIDYMESECKKYGIPFYRIKPRLSWNELYERYGFPSRIHRWCNNKYKLDCLIQLRKFLASQGCYVVSYIGYCYDEKSRWNKRESEQRHERYPLVEHEIIEEDILTWAKSQPIFNNFYLTNRRCGCMYCPMSSFMSFAYLYKYYPDKFEFMLSKMRETESVEENRLGRPISVISSNPKYNADYLDHIIKTKWIHKLNEEENKYIKAFE